MCWKGERKSRSDATGAARSEQLGKALRWGHSRAATGRGAGRARCRLARARVRAEGLYQQEQAPPDMQTGQSVYACLRREVPTDHEARGQAQRRQLRRVAPSFGGSWPRPKREPEPRQDAAVTAPGTSVVHTPKHSFGGSRSWKPKRVTRSTVASVLRLAT